MRARIRGIHDRPMAETPIAVFDFETTGPHPGHDLVLEVSVLRLDPGRPPEVVLDTRVNPRRRVSATEIHGITDRPNWSLSACRRTARTFVWCTCGRRVPVAVDAATRAAQIRQTIERVAGVELPCHDVWLQI